MRLILKKCRVHDNNILFIDASQHFDKAGNQNVLTDEHVEKLLIRIEDVKPSTSMPM